MGSSNAYLVEWQRPSGWRQSNILHFRFRDAMEAAERELADKTNRAVRIRKVTVEAETVFASEQTYPGE